MMSMFHFEKQLVFYGQFHANKINIAIHVICVPIIFWTAVVLVSGLTPPFSMDDGLIARLGFTPNISLIITLMYCLYYILMEPVAGAMISPIMLYACRSATQYALADPSHLWIALYWQVGSWVAQILGHQLFEGRSPAFLDNVSQALLLAPLFVFLEVLFYFGYRPALQKRFKNKVAVEVTHFRRQRAAKVRAAEAERNKKLHNLKHESVKN